MVVWKANKQGAEVDVDEMMKMWKWSNRQVARPRMVCRGCGKECKGYDGLQVHSRDCKVGDFESADSVTVA